MEYPPDGRYIEAQARPYPERQSISDITGYEDSQYYACSRIVSSCRTQKGLLLLHAVGSGKTLTSLCIAFNLHPSIHTTVITIRGLQTAFLEEFPKMKRFYGEESAAAKFNNMRCVFYEEFNADLQALTTLNANNRMKHIQNRYLNRLIIVDEAHKLLGLIAKDKTGGIERMMRYVFSNCAKVIFLTATPLQKGWNDLGVLVKLLARASEPKIFNTIRTSNEKEFKMNFFFPQDEDPDWKMKDNAYAVLFVKLPKFLDILKNIFDKIDQIKKVAKIPDKIANAVNAVEQHGATVAAGAAGAAMVVAGAAVVKPKSSLVAKALYPFKVVLNGATYFFTNVSSFIYHGFGHLYNFLTGLPRSLKNYWNSLSGTGKIIAGVGGALAIIAAVAVFVPGTILAGPVAWIVGTVGAVAGTVGGYLAAGAGAAVVGGELIAGGITAAIVLTTTVRTVMLTTKEIVDSFSNALTPTNFSEMARLFSPFISFSDYKAIETDYIRIIKEIDVLKEKFKNLLLTAPVVEPRTSSVQPGRPLDLIAEQARASVVEKTNLQPAIEMINVKLTKLKEQRDKTGGVFGL